jgi:rare lipoprotein A
MQIIRIGSNTNSKTSLRTWLFAGISSIALAAVVITFATRTVRANTPFSHPATINNSTSSVHHGPTTAGSTTTEKSVNRLLGIASWYGAVFQGRRSANGERFNMYSMTACHPTLPFGSMVRVTNLGNSRSVLVRITDRGDLVDDARVIDLSYAAAQKLEMLEDGLAPVRLEVVSLGHSQQEN